MNTICRLLLVILLFRTILVECSHSDVQKVSTTDVTVVSHAVGFANIPKPTGYEYGPTIVIEGKTIYAFFCASPAGNGWDSIRMVLSTDGGSNWSAPEVILLPDNAYDMDSVCDPTVVQFHGVYYMYHTCINQQSPPDGYKNNRICVAVSDSITGPYRKLPSPVVQFDWCDPSASSFYCTGQPSALVYNDMVYLYYTRQDSSTQPGPNPGYIYLSTSPDGIHFTEANNGNPVWFQRDVDVKYDRSSGLFFMAEGDVGGGASIFWAISSDGINWTPYNTSNVFETNSVCSSGCSNNNPGLAGMPDGSFAGMSFVSYGSSYTSGWGDWHLYRSDFIINPQNNDCSQCATTSCDYACSETLGTNTYGYCAYPGSTDQALCCTCESIPPVPDCSACVSAGISGCVEACAGAGYSIGICGAPGSTDPSECCSCF